MTLQDRKTRTRHLTTLAVAGLVLCALVAGAASAKAPKPKPKPAVGPLVVTTGGGKVRGAVFGSEHRFLGIPYAAPPVGNLRWQPPQAPAPWQGVRSGTKFAPHCAQGAGFLGLLSSIEDCLYLNVFTPPTAKATSHLPVMFWIHGGGLTAGESDDFDPAPLVAKGVVAVTVNYRLGVFGFFSHPALTAESTYHGSGNYGFMDQQAALRWVQRNIARFGGNPANVTIFGQSAGGSSVDFQLVSPTAKGLFAKAIIESGPYGPSQTQADADALGTAFATKVGCGDQTLACLRNVPVTTLVANQPSGLSTPVIDGSSLTQSVASAFASGQFNRVPVVQGSTHDEYRLFEGITELVTGQPFNAAAYVPSIAATFAAPTDVAQTIAAQYPISAYLNAGIAYSTVVTDGRFVCPTRTSLQTISQFTPTYGYEFNDAAPLSPAQPKNPDFPLGAYHFAEVQFLFKLYGASAGAYGVKTPGEKQLATAMIAFWTNFAKTGNPGGGWPQYDASTDRLESLVAPTPTTETGASFAADHKCAFWASLGVGR